MSTRQRVRRSSSNKDVQVFSETCQQSLKNLMEHHGFSRERAVQALLAEITSSGISRTKNDDDETVSDQEVWIVFWSRPEF